MIVSLLIMIAWIDWKTKRIPDICVSGVLIAGIISMNLFQEISFIQRVAGIFVISVPLLLLAIMTRGGIGGGDIKFMAAGGFLFGVEGIWYAFEVGVLCAAGYVLWLLIRKKAERKHEIALGPFLSIGMMLASLKM